MGLISLGNRSWSRFLAGIGLLMVITGSAGAQQITFKRAIDMALRRSGTIAIGIADQVHAHENYMELKSAYLPTVIFGSGLGYQLGVPLSLAGSAPSIFNVTTQQYIVNFAQRDYIRAAATEWNASGLDLQDKRNSVIMDTAILYNEYTTVLGKLKSLHEQENAAQHAEFISTERRKEGLESELDVKRVQLVRARVQMRLAQSEGDADVLRARLARAVGVPADNLEVVEESIPGAPAVNQEADLAKIAVALSPVALLADAKAKSADQKARAESRLLLPSVDLATQYALYASFNNYDQFYLKFSRNNYSFGAEIRFPLFNWAQRAHAEGARADAIKAHKQAEEIRAQVSSDTLKLQRSVRILAAAREVARLDYELSTATLDAMRTRVQTGGATSSDYEQTRIDVSDKYTAYLDASLDLYRVQIQLMRETGDLQDWVAKAPDLSPRP